MDMTTSAWAIRRLLVCVCVCVCMCYGESALILVGNRILKNQMK